MLYISELCEDCAVANEINNENWQCVNQHSWDPWQQTGDHGVRRLTLTAYWWGKDKISAHNILKLTFLITITLAWKSSFSIPFAIKSHLVKLRFLHLCHATTGPMLAQQATSLAISQHSSYEICTAESERNVSKNQSACVSIQYMKLLNIHNGKN